MHAHRRAQRERERERERCLHSSTCWRALLMCFYMRVYLHCWVRLPGFERVFGRECNRSCSWPTHGPHTNFVDGTKGHWWRWCVCVCQRVYMCSSVCVCKYTRKSNPSTHTHIHLQTQMNQYIQMHIIRIEMYANIVCIPVCWFWWSEKGVGTTAIPN